MLLGVLIAVSVLSAVGICLGSGAFQSLSWLWLLPVGFAGSFLAALVVYFIFLLVACALVDMKKPQEKDSPFYRGLAHHTISLLMTLLRVRLHAQGMENAPKEGRFLLVCNHLHDTDPVMLLKAFPKSQLAFISKRENDRKFIIGPLLHKIACQPINRENDREALKTILKCIQLIKEDEVSIGVFPEGYVSLDRKLHPFRSGVFKIAQRAGVPIVVCTLRNTQFVFSNAMRLRPSDVYLHLVAVIGPEELAGMTAVDIGNRVHGMMAADLGPELVLQE